MAFLGFVYPDDDYDDDDANSFLVRIMVKSIILCSSSKLQEK